MNFKVIIENQDLSTAKQNRDAAQENNCVNTKIDVCVEVDSFNQLGGYTETFTSTFTGGREDLIDFLSDISG